MSLSDKSSEYLFQKLIEEKFSYQTAKLFKKNTITLEEVIKINKKKKFDQLMTNQVFDFFDKEEDLFDFVKNFLKSFPKKDVKQFEIYRINSKNKTLENKYSFQGKKKLHKKKCPGLVNKHIANHIVDDFIYEACELERKIEFFLHRDKGKIKALFFYQGDKEYFQFLIEFILDYWKSFKN